MTNDEPMAAAGEASVGDQCHLAPEAATAEGAGGAEHLAHPRTALRPLVADDDHVPGPHPPARIAAVARSSPSNTRARPRKRSALLAGDLGDRALRGELPYSTTRWLSFLDGFDKRPDDVLSAMYLGVVFEILRRLRPVTVRHSPCSSPASSSIFISGWIPPIGDQLGHEVAAARASSRPAPARAGRCG